jgi:hypothetical protein
VGDSNGNRWKSWLASDKNGRLKVAIAIAAVALLLNLHFIRTDSGGEIVWSSQDAYIFISVVRRGFSVNVFAYPFVLLREYVGGVPLPDVELRNFTVIHVTPSKVERYVFTIPGNRPSAEPDLYTPIRGQIFANCPDLGGLCRWVHDHFEPASKEEQNAFNGTSGLVPTDFDNLGGWSKRGFAAGPRNVFARSKVDVGDEFTIWEKIDPIGRTGYAAVSIYIQRRGESPERIWSLDGHPRNVSWFEYLRSFHLP